MFSKLVGRESSKIEGAQDFSEIINWLIYSACQTKFASHRMRIRRHIQQHYTAVAAS